ncbi:hypothetical protein NQU59_16085 [Acinetobacter colistiniresistens]|uniref:hypothetical protein n=1 Tax=Acinetobacter colistiniresistens TaxID=280145 RepID=UPI00211B787E|nr:hypothetical protein [Acinetobacter colistiniresistens]UUM27161.1 hypothetical protein NQU59_16085 [Acinetobacter colistiniresistens]
MATSQQLMQLMNNPNARKMLDLIAATEGVKYGYNTLFGNQRIDDLSWHPNVKKPFTQTDGQVKYTTAAGRYQFLKDTWDGVARQYGLDYEIASNTFNVTGDRLPELGTAIEVHGIDANVYANTTVGYAVGVVRAAYFGQKSRNVKIHDNIFKNCSQVVEFDGSTGTDLISDVYSNTAWLRSQKPYDNRPNVAFGHSEFSFAGVTPDTGNYIEVNLTNNTVYQQAKGSDWSSFNHSDNAVFQGGKFNKVVSKGNTYVGFSSGRHLNYRNNFAEYYFEDTFVSCGHIFDASRPNVNSLLWYQNIDAAWAAGQIKLVVCDDTLKNCLYEAISFNIGVSPINSEYVLTSDKWIIPYYGDEPNSSDTAIYNYVLSEIDGSKPINAQSIKVSGKIQITDGQYFWKKAGVSKKWNMHRSFDALAAPTTPRFFGDVQGDIVDNTAPSSGQPIGYVCTVDGAGSAVGTWKGFGVVS